MVKAKFKQLCREKGISPTSACNAIGISSAAYAQWTDESVPRNSTLKKMAEYFDVSVEYLLQDDTKKTTKFKTDNIQSITPVSVVKFEVLGTVSAGYTGYADEVHTGEFVEVPDNLLGGKDKDSFFVVKVSGESMYPVFMEGDRVLIRRCEYVESGSVAVVVYNGDEATIKKIYYGNGWIDLIPLNPNYPQKRIEGEDMNRVFVKGEVISSMRFYKK